MRLFGRTGALSVEVGGPLAEATRPLFDLFQRERVAARLLDRDPSLWGARARESAANRLGWVGAESRVSAVAADALAAGTRVVAAERLVLVGMGGSSLAAEVVADAGGIPLTVLDGTDPDRVARVLAEGLERTVVVVASKSGETLESAAVYEVLLDAALADGLDPARHFLAVTDPGSVLAASASRFGFPTVLGDATVGGRFSALTPYGLVPAALRGADVRSLGRDAESVVRALGEGAGSNPWLLLGCALGAAATRGRDVLSIRCLDAIPASFGDWLEQLIAESTGKDGRGILPVLGAGGAAAVTASITPEAAAEPAGDPEIVVRGPLGAQFLCWEYATAVACRALGVDPFDQPNVQEAKDAAARLLDRVSAVAHQDASGTSLISCGAIEIGLDDMAASRLGPFDDLPSLIDRLPSLVDGEGYLAVLAYLDRERDARAGLLAEAIAARTTVPVTFGWGPRYLHSTGQYHKGGPQHGAFVVLTGPFDGDVRVPGTDRSLAGILRAQAAGDIESLRRRGRPVVRLHLRVRGPGLAQLAAAVR